MDLSKCQGTRWNGDNPLAHISSPTTTTLSPTFYHHFLCGYSVMTTFSPLTLSGRPFFYYIHFPAKKGRVSLKRGETTVGSVIGVFYPPSTREPIYYLTPNEVTILCPFIIKTCHLWRNVGELWTLINIDQRSYLTSPSHPPHSMDYTLLHIILTEGLILYVLSYNPLYHISYVLSLGGDNLYGGGNNTIHE